MRALYAIDAPLAVFGLASCNTSSSRVASSTAGEACRDVDRHVLATGPFMRARDREVVAELRFDQSSVLAIKEPFQNDMGNLGQDLGNWIESRQ